MQTNQIWKLFLIVVVLAIAGIALYPLDKKLKPGPDLAGGTVFVYQVHVDPEDDAKTTVESVIKVLRKRVDPNGVKNLIWREHAGNRIEVTAPLAPKNVAELREAFEGTRKELFDANLSPPRLDATTRQPSVQQRQQALEAIADGKAYLAKRLTEMAEAFDVLKEAAAEFDLINKQLQQAEQDRQQLPTQATEDQKKQAQEKIAVLAAQIQIRDDVERQAEAQFSAARQTVLDWNIDMEELQAVLMAVDDWGGLNLKQREEAEQTFRRELENLVQHHKDRDAPIRAVANAFFAYAKVKGPLDDPNDLKALLRGAGVLEFRIGPSPDNVPDAAEYRDRLRKRGPEAAADLPYRWFVIDDLDQFADEPNLQQRLETVPEDYFKQRFGMIGQAHRDKYYLLLGNSEDDSITDTEMQAGWELDRAGYGYDRNGFPSVTFELNVTGGRLMSQMTGPGERKGEPMAIVLDGRVITAPSINDTLGTNIEVTRGGGFSAKDQAYLVNTLNAGTLSARLSHNPISENTVGPQLGKDNLLHGLKAAIWALIAVAVFMAIYYLFGGLVAVFALMANMVLILGTMATLQATFTLPGIAGIVLTIGMAVDANVLIFERIREELQRKTDLASAVRLGYGRALVTIIDANLTTLIICLILGHTATAEIKGFAVTLGIGIVSTLFTTLFCTRVIIELGMGITRMRSMPMLPTLIPAIGRALRPNVNWVGKRAAFFSLSAVLIVAGLSAVFTRGKDILDIEFRAGTKVAFTLKDDKTLSLTEVRDRLDAVGREKNIPELTQRVGPSVITLGKTKVQDAQVRAGGFSVATLSQDPNVISIAIKEIFADVLEQEAPLTFKGAGQAATVPPISKQVAAPIRDHVLGRNIGQPDVQNDVSDYLGGVAIRLNDIAPAVTLAQLRQRISRMWDDPRFEHLTWRNFDVIGIELAPIEAGIGPATAPRYRSAVVVVASDTRTNYAESDQRFYTNPRGLAASIWKLVHEALRRNTSLDSVSSISPQISATMRTSAIVAMLLSLLAIVAYIWFRFGSLRYGLAAITALVHDVTIALGLVTIAGYVHDTPLGHALGLTDFKVNLALVAALLTIVGYSLNDTIVIFDRIRENRGRLAVATSAIINDSINQTISRTVLTSGTTLVALFILYLFGGAGVHGFAFAMIVGVLVGTYSSIGVAAPLLLIGPRDHKQPSETSH